MPLSLDSVFDMLLRVFRSCFDNLCQQNSVLLPLLKNLVVNMLCRAGGDRASPFSTHHLRFTLLSMNTSMPVADDTLLSPNQTKA